MNTYDVLIVGGGHAGAQAAIMLRQLKFEGSLAIVGAEPDPPYERPPLSKDYLSGEKGFDRLTLLKGDGWADRRVELLLGQSAMSIDPAAKRIVTDRGESIGYGRLIWAAGGSPRMLTCPGAELKGVHCVRRRADVDRMRAELPLVGRTIVIGGGYIGLETAAILSKLGKQVTVLEAEGRVLARVAGEPLSRFFEAEHRAHGVEVRLGARIAAIEGEGGRATGVRIQDGELVPGEMVVVGIGIDPEIAPLRGAGARCSNGVEVDAFCRTSIDDIFAIGDCAAHHNRYANSTRIRLESVQNANDQAATVARAICGSPQPYEAVPWFWSNQYDLRLQTVGLSIGHDRALVRGDPASRSFSVVYVSGPRVIALDCVNAVRDYTQGRALVAARAAPDAALLADPAIPLKSLLHQGDGQ